MLLSEKIARIIEGMLADNGGCLELQRNKLADEMGCVPSQINYVITSRFSTDRGYIVESRRGGGGFIKITKVSFDKGSFLMHLLGAVGSSIDEQSARALLFALFENTLISEREFKIISALMTDKALCDIQEKQGKDKVRADMLKSLVLTITNV
jgi:Transcriptional repressor of class III stress genes